MGDPGQPSTGPRDALRWRRWRTAVAVDATAEAVDARAQRALRRAGVAGAGAAGAPERLAAAAGGSLAITLALRQRTRMGKCLAAAVAGATYRAIIRGQGVDRLFGFSPLPADDSAIVVERSVRVLRPRSELYGFWRDLSNHPRFVQGLRVVERLEERRARWRVETAAGRLLTWEAEILEEREGELLRWRALPGGAIAHCGRVEFLDAPRGETEVRLGLEFTRPPRAALGMFGTVLAGELANRRASADLRRFKQLIEAGEIATVSSQPAGRRSRLGRALCATVAGRDRR